MHLHYCPTEEISNFSDPAHCLGRDVEWHTWLSQYWAIHCQYFPILIYIFMTLNKIDFSIKKLFLSYLNHLPSMCFWDRCHSCENLFGLGYWPDKHYCWIFMSGLFGFWTALLFPFSIFLERSWDSSWAISSRVLLDTFLFLCNSL